MRVCSRSTLTHGGVHPAAHTRVTARCVYAHAHPGRTPPPPPPHGGQARGGTWRPQAGSAVAEGRQRGGGRGAQSTRRPLPLPTPPPFPKGPALPWRRAAGAPGAADAEGHAEGQETSAAATRGHRAAASCAPHPPHVRGSRWGWAARRTLRVGAGPSGRAGALREDGRPEDRRGEGRSFGCIRLHGDGSTPHHAPATATAPLECN